MAYTINFTAQITTELDQRLRVERDKKIYRRLLCLDLLRQGYSRQQIASILRVSSYSVTQWVKCFIEGGFENVCHLNYEGRRTSRFYHDAIRQQVQSQSVSTLKELQHWLAETFGVSIDHTWLSRWLKKKIIPTKRLA